MKNIKIKKFIILAFPCNQFGFQEPKSNQDIREFANGFGVKFPLFDKINVNGESAIPLYKFLTKSISETVLYITYNRIAWNFAKFLVDKNGNPVKRYSPKQNPLSFENDILNLINNDKL